MGQPPDAVSLGNKEDAMNMETGIFRGVMKLVLGAGMLLAMITSGGAAEYTWDADTGTVGAQNGNGEWNTTSANWWDSSGNSNIVWPNADDIAVFGIAGGSGTITNNGIIHAGGLRISTNATYTIQSYAGILNLGTDEAIQCSTSATFTVYNKLVATNLTIARPSSESAGAVAITFYGTNDLAGNLVLGSGVNLDCRRPQAIGSATVIIQSGIQSGSSKGLNLNNATAAGVYTNAFQVWTGSIIRVSSSATTFSGPITLNGNCDLLWGNAGSANTTVSGPIGGTGNMAIKNSGSNFLTGASSYNGATTLSANNGATIVILDGGDNRLPATTIVTNSGGTLVLGYTSAMSQTLAGLIGSSNVVGGSAAGVNTLKLNIAAGTTNTFAGTLGGGGANQNNLALTLTGGGRLVLSGTNTYKGATVVSNGTLIASSTNALAGTTNIIVTSSGSLVATNLHIFSNCTLNASGANVVTTNLLVDAGAVLTPGGSGVIATNTFGTSLNDTAAINGTYEVDLSSNQTAACDRIVAAGSLNLGGMTIKLANPSVYNAGVSYVIATYSNSVTMPGAIQMSPPGEAVKWLLINGAGKEVILKRASYGAMLIVY